MPTADKDAIRRTLAHRAGSNTHSGAVAEAAVSTWHQLTVRLTPVIGVRGVDALFRRSLYLVSKDYPWLAIVGNEGGSTSLLASLQRSLAAQEVEIAKEVGASLLLVFTELLTAMIGISVSERLLGPVWVLPKSGSSGSAGPEQDNAP